MIKKKNRAIKKSDKKLKNLASQRLSIIEKNKDIIVNNIYLGGGVKKNIESDSKVFSNVFVSPSTLNKKKPYSSFIAEDVLYNTEKDAWWIDINLEYISDNVGVSFINPSFRGNYKTWSYDTSIAANGFRFEDDHCINKAGGSVEFSGNYKQSISTQQGSTQFSPFINLSFVFDSSDFDFQVYKRSLFYEKLSCNSFTEHHNKYGLKLSGNIEFSKYQSLWYSIDSGYIDDSNIEIIPQYNLVIFKDNYINNFIPIKYNIALDGYYIWNKNQNNDYYSPKFFDSTVVSFNPTFIVNNKFNLVLQSSIGYSFYEKTTIFRYGIWAEYLFKKKLKMKAGCSRSNIGSSSAGGNDYNYNQCLVSMGYEW